MVNATGIPEGRSSTGLSVADIVVIAVYILSVIAVGIWSMFQSKRGTLAGYFLAGRFMTFFPVGLSLYASNIGSEHLVGLAGSGAAAGIGVGAFEINALLFLQLLGFVFLPVYIASGVYTLPEYIHKRFGGNRIRMLLSLLSLLLYIFTKLSVNMYAGALFIQQTVGWNLYLAVFLLLALTGVCTITGGLAAVIYLDSLMAFVMVGGAATMTIMGFAQIGGYAALRTKYMNALASDVREKWQSGLTNLTCGVPAGDSFILMRNAWTSDIPWLGFLTGQTTASIWYWCADQVIVQRALAAKSLSHAQGGTILAGYIKILPLFIMVMPGMISRVLFPDEVGCVDPEKCMKICESRNGCSNIAIPKLVMNVLPSGVRGMMLAVMMAALMSDLTSIFNSASTLFTMDVYRRVRGTAGTRELMIVGRVFIFLLCVIGICWIPVIRDFQGGQLFLYVQAISAYLSPPITAVYLLAILWKRANEKGAFWGMMAGFVTGVTRMVLDFVYPSPHCGETDSRPALIRRFHYMYFALLLFVVTLVMDILVSLCTEKADDEMLIRTTVWTRHDSTIRSDEIQEEIDALQHDEAEQRTRLNSVLATDRALEMKERRGSIRVDEDVEFLAYKQRLPCWLRTVDTVCGLSDDIADEKKTAEEQKTHLREVTSLKQNWYAKMALRLNAVVIVLVGIFMCVFFSVPDGGPTRPTLPLLGNGTSV